MVCLSLASIGLARMAWFGLVSLTLAWLYLVLLDRPLQSPWDVPMLFLLLRRCGVRCLHPAVCQYHLTWRNNGRLHQKSPFSRNITIFWEKRNIIFTRKVVSLQQYYDSIKFRRKKNKWNITCTFKNMERELPHQWRNNAGIVFLTL